MANPVPPNKGPRDRRDGRLPGSRPQGLLWWVLALLLGASLAQVFLFMPSGRTIGYSEFKSMVKAGQVARVSVGPETITGELKASPRQRDFGSTLACLGYCWGRGCPIRSPTESHISRKLNTRARWWPDEGRLLPQDWQCGPPCE